VDEQRRYGSEDYDANFARNIIKNPRLFNNMEEYDEDINVSVFEDKRKKMSREKVEALLKCRSLSSVKRLEKCWFCYDNPSIAKHLIVSLGEHVYLAMSATPFVKGHTIITPLKHFAASNELTHDAQEEIKKFKMGLAKMFAQQKQSLVFTETVLDPHKQYHTVIECYPLPKTVATDAPLYFKKAMMEAETEWAQHKKNHRHKQKGDCCFDS